MINEQKERVQNLYIHIFVLERSSREREREETQVRIKRNEEKKPLEMIKLDDGRMKECHFKRTLSTRRVQSYQ